MNSERQSFELTLVAKGPVTFEPSQFGHRVLKGSVSHTQLSLYGCQSHQMFCFVKCRWRNYQSDQTVQHCTGWDQGASETTGKTFPFTDTHTAPSTHDSRLARSGVFTILYRIVSYTYQPILSVSASASRSHWNQHQAYGSFSTEIVKSQIVSLLSKFMQRFF